MRHLVTSLFMVLSLGLGAQPNEKRFEKIEALRVEFISNELDLTVEEAKAFWPLYDEFKNAERKIHGKRMGEFLGHGAGHNRFEEMDDTEIEKLMEEEIAKQRALIDLREKYMQRFKKVLPIKKVAMLFKAEHDFHRALLNRLREKRGAKKP